MFVIDDTALAISRLKLSLAQLREQVGADFPYEQMAEDLDFVARQHNAVALSREQLQLVIKSTGVGIWDWHVQTGETVFNERWADIIGYTLDELAPVSIKTWETCAHPDDLEESGRRLQEHWQGLTDYYIFESRMKHKDGSWVWVYDTGKVIEWTEDGKPSRMIGTHLDITEQKNLEEICLRQREQLLSQAQELQASHQRLEQLVRERTEQLEREKLNAENANKVKTGFLATMSHEIRTPMNGVLGISALLEDTDLTARQRSYVRHLKTSGEIALTVLNDILDFSKLQAGQINLEFSTVDLRAWCQELVQSFRLLIDKPIDLRLEIAADLPAFVKTDKQRLYQVLSNIVSNAIKFTRKGHIQLSFSAHDQSKDDAVLYFQVEDSGIGMNHEVMKIIFDPFAQAENWKSREFGGTGLGLPISKNIISLMGGTIEVKSVENRGSKFTVKLPVNVVRHHHPEQAPSIHSRNFSDLRVLLVEDNAINQIVVCGQLEALGIATVVAASGAEALAIVYDSHDELDLILMDCEMPNISGLEVTERIREWEKNNNKSRLPIFALTAHVLVENTIECEMSGMDGKVTKPSRVEDLVNVLDLVAGKELFQGARRFRII